MYRVPVVKYIDVGDGAAWRAPAEPGVPRITARSVVRQKYNLWRSLCNDHKLSCYLRARPALILSSALFFCFSSGPRRVTRRTLEISLNFARSNAKVVVVKRYRERRRRSFSCNLFKTFLLFFFWFQESGFSISLKMSFSVISNFSIFFLFFFFFWRVRPKGKQTRMFNIFRDAATSTVTG